METYTVIVSAQTGNTRIDTEVKVHAISPKEALVAALEATAQYSELVDE